MDQDREVVRSPQQPRISLRRAVPTAWAGFTALHDGAMADGEVPRHTKEAVALAISVVKRCDGCITHHARAAARAGATPAEVAEVLAVALLMDGGTASVYAPKAWEAFQDFRSQEVGVS